MIIFVDTFSRFTHILGLEDKSTNTVIQAMQQFAADHLLVTEFGYIDIGKVKADAGSQFSLESFKTFCCEQGLSLSLAAHQKQSQNHFAKWAWQAIHNMAHSMIVHA